MRPRGMTDEIAPTVEENPMNASAESAAGTRKTIMFTADTHALVTDLAREMKVPRWMVVEQAVRIMAGTRKDELAGAIKAFRAERRLLRTHGSQQKAELRRLLSGLSPSAIAELLAQAKAHGPAES
jgi:hypothetical protein